MTFSGDIHQTKKLNRFSLWTLIFILFERPYQTTLPEEIIFFEILTFYAGDDKFNNAKNDHLFTHVIQTELMRYTDSCFPTDHLLPVARSEKNHIVCERSDLNLSFDAFIDRFSECSRPYLI